MALKYNPRPGNILLCDFEGFKEPEMIKKRPVIVLSIRHKLCVIVPLSTTEPNPIEKHHHQIPSVSLPDRGKYHTSKSTWVKGDMIYTVSYERLTPIILGRDRNGKRQYFNQRLGRDQMKTVYSCVLYGLNLPELPAYL